MRVATPTTKSRRFGQLIKQTERARNMAAFFTRNAEDRFKPAFKAIFEYIRDAKLELEKLEPTVNEVWGGKPAKPAPAVESGKLEMTPEAKAKLLGMMEELLKHG